MADDRSTANEALKTYRAKRRFDATPEPAGGGTADESQRAFVVQKHWASRLHYDFRLELEGTMKSWAVPKGPSYDPQDKRLAMPTEDHPISYNQFEGTIPAGNYGAGKVIIWDKGTWIPLEDPHKGYRDGKLKFELRGHKLHGHWTLVRTKGRGGDRDAWLLIKERDAFARPASEFSVVDEQADSVKHLDDRPAALAVPGSAAREQKPAREGPPEAAVAAKLPDTLQPQLATLAEHPPEDEGRWLYEIKFDGYRMLARAEKGRVRLVTRNGNDWTSKLAPLRESLEAMDLPDGWYDGEIIMPGKESPSDFQALQGAFDTARTADIVYYLFDLPYCAGYDLRPVPLEERRAVLRRIVERKPQPQVRFSEVFDARAQDVLESACKLGLEGVIAKRRDAPYATRRSADWLKLKCQHRQEFVIGGFTDPKGARTGIGSLLLGVHDDQGRLQYAGNVGTGFNEQTLLDLRRRLDALAATKAPFASGAGLPRGAHWVKPELMAEVAFGEWTRDGRVRHSVFHGLRADKPPKGITREVAQEPPAGEEAARTSSSPSASSSSPPASSSYPPASPSSPSASSPSPSASSSSPRRRGSPASTRGRHEASDSRLRGNDGGPSPAASSVALPSSLRVSHPERVVDPDSGLTKIDLVRYYALVAPLMMEHLKNRPIAMVRAPDGITGQLFFQKHLDRYKMAGVAQLDPAIFPGHPAMLEIAKPEGLLSAAQMNVIEFHTWNAVAKKSGTPDRMIFDVDPGEGVEWPQIQEAAVLVRTFLEELGLPVWLKTSGGKGLHLVVPLKPKHGWDTVKDFSQAIVNHLARTIPQRFVAKAGAKNRVGKIFIDYLRNGFGATTACAWSARARPGLGISVPVRWDEVKSLKGGAHWTVARVHERLDEGNAPWEGYAASSIAPDAAMKKLGFSPR